MNSTLVGDQPFKVILGAKTMRAFVAAPKDMKILGIVQIGLEFGLLAISRAGRYIRVNGSQVEKLDKALIGIAIEAARNEWHDNSTSAIQLNKIPLSPKIAYRKRRSISI